MGRVVWGWSSEWNCTYQIDTFPFCGGDDASKSWCLKYDREKTFPEVMVNDSNIAAVSTDQMIPRFCDFSSESEQILALQEQACEHRIDL
jgi:hypothetical protein